MSIGRRSCQALITTPLVTGILFAAALLAAEVNRPGVVAGDDLFAQPRVVRLQITVSETNAAALREQPRQYVQATLREEGGTTTTASLRLKGRSGSFRPLEDKPALTLDFTRGDQAGRFHGLQKIHLNNSVEDPTFLCEFLGSGAFADAGLPAARSGWAVVELNGRALGLYVLKEGFSPEFLERHFGSSSGNLYEATPANDVDGRLVRDSGSGPDSQEDLRQLAAVALKTAPEERWARLGEVLDTERFLTFAGLEVILGHRDGYCLARNNYRLYHEPVANRFVFLPHGMDILFGRPDATWRPVMSGAIASAVLETPEGRKLFRSHVEALMEQVLNLPRITNRIDAALRAFKPALPGSDYARITSAAAGLEQRITLRKANLLRQLRQPEIPLLSFRSGSVLLTNDWRAMDATAGTTLDQHASPDGRAALHLKAGPRTSASWRCRVRVPAGSYRLEAMAMTRGVTPLPFGRNHGAAVRANGLPSEAKPGLRGDAAWQSVAAEFSVGVPEQEVELVCELRASAGEAWFEMGTARLTRIHPAGTPVIDVR